MGTPIIIPVVEGEEQVLKVGGKIPFEFRGRDVIFAIIILLIAVIFILGQFNLRLWGEPFNIQKALSDHEEKVSTEHKAFVEVLEESTYVTAICFNPARRQECDAINLQMPDSMRKKLRRD